MGYETSSEKVYTAIRAVIQESLAPFGMFDTPSLEAPTLCRENLFTVYTTLEGDYHIRLVFCSEQVLLKAIAENMLEETVEDYEDTVECAKEFFNVVCGQIAAVLFKTIRAKERFPCPCFAEGYFLPENEEADSLMTFYYTGEQYKPALFLHDKLTLLNEER